ncbi:MAG: hypothetical protein Q7T19_04305 [Caulobacter sp.]|nr:hypothetical protein [Caulobacter sp.]
MIVLLRLALARCAVVAAIFPPGTVIAEAAIGLLETLNRQRG